MLGFAVLIGTGELHGVANGATMPESTPAAGRRPPFPLDGCGPLDDGSTAEKRSYPFTALFAKESLGFLSFKPAVHGARVDLRFPELKTYSCLFKLKYAF